MSIQLRCVDTDLVLPVATRLESGRLRDIYYKVELINDFPELAIAVSLGTQATLTPKEDKPGFKSKGVLDTIYRPLVVCRFNRQMQPALEINPLMSQPVATNGSEVYVYPDGKSRESRVYANHAALINDYVMPTAVKALLSETYKMARFSSWLYVGLLLLDRVQHTITENGDSFTQALKPLTQDDLFEIVTTAHSDLVKAKAYVSQSHAMIAEKLKSKQLVAATSESNKSSAQ
jgi:hypothetical protein